MRKFPLPPGERVRVRGKNKDNPPHLNPLPEWERKQ